jgi:hypothetical protein
MTYPGGSPAKRVNDFTFWKWPVVGFRRLSAGLTAQPDGTG